MADKKRFVPRVERGFRGFSKSPDAAVPKPAAAAAAAVRSPPGRQFRAQSVIPEVEDDDAIIIEPAAAIPELLSPGARSEASAGGVVDAPPIYLTETTSWLGNTTSIKTTGLYQAAPSNYSAFMLQSGPGSDLVRNCRIRKGSRVKPDPGTKQAYGVQGNFTAFAYGCVFVPNNALVMEEPLTALSVIRMDHLTKPLLNRRRFNATTPIVICLRQPNISSASGATAMSNPASAESAAYESTLIPLGAEPPPPLRFSASSSRPGMAPPDAAAGAAATPFSPYTPPLLFRSSVLALMDEKFKSRAWKAIRMLTPGLYNTVINSDELQNRVGIFNDVLLTIEEFSSRFLPTDPWSQTLLRVLELIGNPGLAMYFPENSVVKEADLNMVSFVFAKSVSSV